MSNFFTAKKIASNPAEQTVPDGSTPVPVDVFRTRDKLVILAPIAGVTIEEISVSITDDILTISGNRSMDQDEKPESHFSQECFWGDFNRTIVLPVNVDSSKVAAFYKRGILRIEMPILDEEQTRVIPVKMQGD